MEVTMARDDEQIWAEIVQNFHSSTGSERPQWPAAENVEPESETSGQDSSTSDSGGSTSQGDGSTSDSGGSTSHGILPERPEASPAGPGGTPEGGGDHPAASRPSEYDPEEHFVPPAPPPLPRTDLITRLAWLCVLGTPLFFLLALIAGRPVSGFLGALGAGAFIGGFVLLVVRLRGHDPYDPDDGAVV
ncbi:MAG: hypothetical protein ACOCUN_01135 [Jiangellaceae bacterium]